MLIQNKQIAIIGGGMGGLLLARLLQMENIQVKVYERDANQQVRVQGSPLDLHEDSGLKAMKKADLLDEFYKNIRPNASKTRIVNQKMELKFDEHAVQKAVPTVFSKTNTDSLQNISKPRPEIDRADLHKVLIDSLKPGTIIWESHFISMEDENQRWKIHFKNGYSAYADLVIAADGANSKVRSYLSNLKPVYSGITMLEGTIYNANENVPALFEFSKGGKVLAFGNGQTIMYGTKGDGSLMFLTSTKTTEKELQDKEHDFKDNKQIFNWFKTTFKDWSEEWNALFTSSELYFIPRPQYYFPLNQSWKTKENLTMIGDAAHRMPPFAGKGANLALLDAVELARNLTSDHYSDTKTAISDFENDMLQRAAKATKETLENATQLFAENALDNLVAIFKNAH